MKLSLKNIGKIQDTTVEINGITVIAGENNTGKSTVSKALYCLFTAFHDIDKKIKVERQELIQSAILSPLRRFSPALVRKIKLKKIVSKICDSKSEYIQSNDKLKIEIYEIFSTIKSEHKFIIPDEELNKVVDDVLSYLNIGDEVIKNRVLTNVLSQEFNMQISHVNDKDKISEMTLNIHNFIINVEFKNNQPAIKSSMNIEYNLFYIEDPFVIDELEEYYFLPYRFIEGHKSKTVVGLNKRGERALVGNAIEEIRISEKLNNILTIVNNICKGSIKEVNNNFMYSSEKLKEPISISNLSTGFKSFLIIKTLLMNGALEEGGTIILDEPEIHLHPEWQLKFAEIIILLNKDFGMHILLNTHSPYFLNAIEVYSKKYAVESKCKYYLAENIDDVSVIKDVTDNTELIYKQLARPLQDLENMRWSDD